jgi:hypothetical protein
VTAQRHRPPAQVDSAQLKGGGALRRGEGSSRELFGALEVREGLAFTFEARAPGD